MNCRKKEKSPFHHPAYSSWAHMIKRCTNPKNKDYSLYGDRGIKVCDRWLESYYNFVEDMGEKPKERTLDRINCNGNYEPYNCRWATNKEQARNKRNNRLITIHGETKTLAEWAEENEICHSVLIYRIKNGVKPDKLLSKERLKPKNYEHFKNIYRKNNKIIELNGKNLTIAQWARKTGLSPGLIRQRIFESKWSIEDALSKSTDRKWNHGTNTGYSKYKCRCLKCKEYNKKKSQRARDKLKKYGMQRKIDPSYHGTRTGYELYRCRCKECCFSNSIINKSYREKIKENV